MKKFFLLVIIAFALFFPTLIFASASFCAYITTAASKNISVIETSTQTIAATISTIEPPFSIAINPSGTKAYVTHRNYQAISVIDILTNTAGQIIIAGEGPSGIAINPSGTKAYVTNNESNNVSVIDTSTDTVTATISVGENPDSIAINPSGTRVYVANNSSATVSVIDTLTDTVIQTIIIETNPEARKDLGGIAFNPSGTRVYAANGASNNIAVIDTSTNTVIQTITTGTDPEGIAFNPSGTKAYVANGGSNDVSVIDVATNTEIQTIAVGANPQRIAIDPSGTKAYVTNFAANTVSVIDTSTNTVSDTITVGNNPFDVAISSDTFAPATTATPKKGKYNSVQKAVLSAVDQGGSGIDKIYYTTDGKNPTTSSKIYSSPIVLTRDATLKYFAVDKAGNQESVKTSQYKIQKAKFVTKKEGTLQALIKKKKTKYYANDFEFFLNPYPKKLKTKKYYLEIERKLKYPRAFGSLFKNKVLKKYWISKTNLNKYQPKASIYEQKQKKENYKITLTFKYTSKEFKAFKKRSKTTKESDLRIKYWQPYFKTWRNMATKHNQEKNTFTVTFEKFFYPLTYFAVGV